MREGEHVMDWFTFGTYWAQTVIIGLTVAFGISIARNLRGPRR